MSGTTLQYLGIEKGRQLGFTWVSAIRILRRIFTSPVAQDHYWISRDEFTAKAIPARCAYMARMDERI